VGYRRWGGGAGPRQRAIRGLLEQRGRVPPRQPLAAAGSVDHLVMLWDIGTGAAVRSMTARSHDGRKLATASGDYTASS
jgi:hypothetical protein